MMNIIASLLLVAASFRVGVAELLEYKKLLKGGVLTSREPKQFHRKLAPVTYPPEAPNSTPLIECDFEIILFGYFLKWPN